VSGETFFKFLEKQSEENAKARARLCKVSEMPMGKKLY
jgi:hypothetical protein